MATEEDNFNIDIYGDGEGDMGNDGNMDYKQEDDEPEIIVTREEVATLAEKRVEAEPEEESAATKGALPGKENAADDQSPQTHTASTKPAPQQGTKRKDTPDERPVDPEATNALMISDLHWWTTEDDIRGWTNEIGAEEELRELTFSEHKVNGKSKGQVYLEFSSPQATTAAKHKIESLAGSQPSARKHTVAYTSGQNLFKTLPKDAPVRTRDDRPSRGGSFNSGPRTESNYGNPGYRGGRGGNFNRGGYNSNPQYNNNNRNYSGGVGGYNNNNMGFQGNMGVGNNYGGFNRGGMMGAPMRGNMGNMRGGRGGMNNMMAMGGPMNMGMGMGMGMGNMGMNPMMAGMGMTGFQGNQFNPGMFNPSQGQNFGNGSGDWNQHGAKRQRQE